MEPSYTWFDGYDRVKYQERQKYIFVLLSHCHIGLLWVNTLVGNWAAMALLRLFGRYTYLKHYHRRQRSVEVLAACT